MRAGVSYLRGVQRRGGGFPLAGGIVNAQSTAYATQGLIAAGVSPPSVRKGGSSPLDYLASVQAGDGHYRYSASSDQTPVWVTGQALLAASGEALPLSPVPRNAAAAPAPAAVPGSAAKPKNASPANTPPKAAQKPAPASGATMGSPAQPPTLPLAPASSSEAGGNGGGGIPAWVIVIVGLVVAAGAVWGGWILIQRRLPS
jgi:hypothetical protein